MKRITLALAALLLLLPSLALAQGGGGVPITIGGGGHTVEEEGTPLTPRSSLNFVGSAITCADSGGKTVCTVTGGATGLTADSGGATTGTAVNLLGGSNGIDTVRSGDTVTFNFDVTETSVVVGPSSVTDSTFALFDTTTGKLLKGGGPAFSTSTNVLTFPSSSTDGGLITFAEDTDLGSGTVTFGINADVANSAKDCRNDANNQIPATCLAPASTLTGSVTGATDIVTGSSGSGVLQIGQHATSGAGVVLLEGADTGTNKITLKTGNSVNLSADISIQAQAIVRAFPSASGQKGPVVGMVSGGSDTGETLCDAMFQDVSGPSSSCVAGSAKSFGTASPADNEVNLIACSDTVTSGVYFEAACNVAN